MGGGERRGKRDYRIGWQRKCEEKRNDMGGGRREKGRGKKKKGKCEREKQEKETRKRNKTRK